MSIKGVDISSYQGSIGALGSDIEFVIVKVTEGTGYVNPSAFQQITQARNDGKIVGQYHFADMNDATAEANWFCDRMMAPNEGEILALDWETGTYSDFVDSWCAQFINVVKQRLGFTPLIYSNAARINSGAWPLTRSTDAGLWIAGYSSAEPNPSPWPFAAIWQYSSSGREQGINGNVDVDTFFGDAETLKKYGKPTPPPAPAPVPAPVPTPTPVVPVPTPQPTPVTPPVETPTPVVVPVSKPSPAPVLPQPTPRLSLWQLIVNWFKSILRIK